MSAVPRNAVAGGLLDDFDQRLPFVLTQGQQEVGATIATDLGRTYPMHRLLQGEVGSGKTVVALRAMLTVVDTGGQAALLAPTEVLAQQHARSITAMLGPLAEAGMLGHDGPGTQVSLLTGSASTQSRKKAMLGHRVGHCGDCHRHPCAASAERRVLRPWPRRGRRAAPLRRRAARRIASQGPNAAARPGDDSDTDSENRGDVSLRRP